ncbi:MAG TPA: M23 family metallopeptidase, partial [Acidimicrobiia bacterium]|nr:M23 family metallopeptidase [Acidimicrobiia bacterium]
APTTTAPAMTTSTASPTTTTTSPPEPECNIPFVYPMVFPIVGAGDIGSHFGAPRDGGRRHHLGNDIFAPVLQPVAAVADGTVTRIAGDTGISGYRVHVHHDDGWSSLYIHLNNDTAGTDDSNGIGIRPDLQEGDRVEAGEVIGWNGDSGNAESTSPHVHFELRDPSGTSIDPQASLESAPRLTEASFSGPFLDLDPTDADIHLLTVLLSRGVPVWCDEPSLTCPGDPATSAAITSWLEALTGPIEPPTGGSDQVTEGDIARLIAWNRLKAMYAEQDAWLGEGISDGSLSAPVPEPPADPRDLAPELAYAILGGPSRCLPIPDDGRHLTREEAAEKIALYLGWSPGPSYCATNSANR